MSIRYSVPATPVDRRPEPRVWPRADSSPGTCMALQGSLQELRLGDVVQTVLQAGNRGLLRVRSAGRRAVLYLSPEGVRLLEPAPLDERVIVEAFVRRGTITDEAVARAQAVTGGKAPLDGLG